MRRLTGRTIKGSTRLGLVMPRRALRMPVWARCRFPGATFRRRVQEPFLHLDRDSPFPTFTPN
jgi:hypothetical protein